MKETKFKAPQADFNKVQKVLVREVWSEKPLTKENSDRLYKAVCESVRERDASNNTVSPA